MRPAGILIYAIANLFVLQAMPFYVGGNLAIRIVLALLITFVATLVHELGHALAARLAGAEIRAIMVVPFRLQLRPRKLRWAGPAGSGDIGGYVTYTLDRIQARHRHALIAAAGPAANLLLAGLADGIASVLAQAGYHGAHGWFGTLASLSGLMFFYNLIPFPGSDGQHILAALRKPRRRA